MKQRRAFDPSTGILTARTNVREFANDFKVLSILGSKCPYLSAIKPVSDTEIVVPLPALPTLLQVFHSLSQEDKSSIAEDLHAMVNLFYSHGICHGDLHAENVLVYYDGEMKARVKAIDFEHARFNCPKSCDSQYLLTGKCGNSLVDFRRFVFRRKRHTIMRKVMR